jgi:hypothetical protein
MKPGTWFLLVILACVPVLQACQSAAWVPPPCFQEKDCARYPVNP